MNTRVVTMGLLLVSGLLLATLIPGGPVENREFSHIHPLVLGFFNLFLTVLGLGSMWMTYVMFRAPVSSAWPALIGLGFVAVYGLDLLEIFPVSPTPMSHALWSIEVTGLILAALLVVLNRRRTVLAAPGPVRAGPTRKPALGLILLIVIAVTAFATCAAIGLCRGS